MWHYLLLPNIGSNPSVIKPRMDKRAVFPTMESHTARRMGGIFLHPTREIDFRIITLNQ